MQEKYNYNAIDVAKFIFAIFVILIHVPVYQENTLTAGIALILKFYLSKLAVPFFFISSSFFLFRRIDMEHIDTAIVRKYITKLFKVYVFWFCIYLICGFNSVITENTGLTQLLYFIREFIFSNFTPLWFITALIFAVCFVTFLLYKKIAINKILFIGFIFYLIGLFGQTWYFLLTPLETHWPAFWDILIQVEEIIYTTRNGLFNGVLFVAFGAFFSVRLEKCNKKTYFALGIFLTFLLLEIIICNKWQPRFTDMYLFLVPCSYLLFKIIANTKLNLPADYPFLRKMSTIIFYTHMLIYKLILFFFITFSGNMLFMVISLFPVVLLISLFIAFCIVKISENPKYKLVKNLY